MRVLSTKDAPVVFLGYTFLVMVVSFALAECSPSPGKQHGQDVYEKNCSGCHGHQLQGSTASALIKETLKYGNDRKSIINNIRNGIAGTEMIRWDSTLSDEDMEAVSDYILAVRESPETVKTDVKPLKIETKLYKLNIERVITEGLNGPWGIEFVDANRALITCKLNELYWMVSNKLDTQKITGLPKLYAYDMLGGMMDLALDPDYKNNGWVYLAFGHRTQNATDSVVPCTFLQIHQMPCYELLLCENGLIESVYFRCV